MTRSSILFAALFALLLFVAIDAQAVDTTKYPATLVDQTCTDAKDTVTGQGPFSTFVQDTTGGGADGLCDHDNRILTGALTSDTTFGPFRKGCVYLLLDPSAVTGGDTKWFVHLQIKRPHTGVLRDYDIMGEAVAASGKAYLFGAGNGQAASQIAEVSTVPLPSQWWFQLNLNTATSWTGEIGMVSCR
jgi:hypothetical protein